MASKSNLRVFQIVFLFLSTVRPTPLMNYERPDLFEGDLILDVEQAVNILEPRLSTEKREPLGRNIQFWPNGVIPYEIDRSLDYNVLKVVQAAIAEFHSKTCVRFVPRTSQPDYLVIQDGQGCYSSVGMKGGAQHVFLGDTCDDVSIVEHELMHTLGFFHEHSRKDRDNNVMILWWNIIHGQEKNFLIYEHPVVDELNLPYDLHSLLHYPKFAFSKSRESTIEAISDTMTELGSNNGFSKYDLEKINSVYKCTKTPIGALDDCEDKFKSCTIVVRHPAWCNRVQFGRTCPRSCQKC